MQEKTEKVPRTPAGWMLGSEFVATQGRKCPKCGGKTQVIGDPVYRYPNIVVPTSCDACPAKFDTLYGLIGYDPKGQDAVSGGAQEASDGQD